jgi:hypothetical protein
MVSDAKEGEVKHDRTGKVSPPVFPFTTKFEAKEKASRREQLAAWISSPDNRFFASSYANRLWGYLTGAGVIEPLDDTRAGNPPRNPALLDYLTHEFIDSGFNPRHMMALICKSRAYQLSIRVNKWNEDDKVNYSHALARRLPAETLFDSVFRVTGAALQIPGAKPGQRASQLADAGTDVASGLLATLGRPVRESACECERSSDIRLGSVMALLSGPTVSTAINDPKNALAQLVADQDDDEELVNDVFLRVLNRPATEPETTNALALLAGVGADNTQLTNELGALEIKLAPSIKELTRQRDEAIAKAKAGLATYDDMTKTLRAELDKRHQAEVAATQRELKDYEKLLPAQAAFWETKNNPAETKNVWTLVTPTKLTATGKNKLAQQTDGSITSTGGKSPADFVIVAKPALTHITGVMLEVLPDEKLPRFGPGRAPDGNLVLSEIELKWGAGTNAANMPAKFSEARADFSQTDFSVSRAIDGVATKDGNGWALAGAPGPQRHLATFKLEKPLDSTNGLALRLVLKQNYGDQFLLGRFRLYLTASDDPLDFGLPEPVVAAARAPAGQRAPEQAGAILDYYRYTDSEFWKRKQAAVNAAAPLPADPKYTELKTALTTAEAPIALDPFLVQLRDDAKASARQSENKRLTVVQDLTWALINSAGFLFNH